MDSRQTKAYQLFKAEVRKHLATAVSVLSGAGDPDPAELRRAVIAVHTLKGSAGFFGHVELASAARELEEKIRNPLFSLHKNPEVQSLLDALAAAVAAIPLPDTPYPG